MGFLDNIFNNDDKKKPKPNNNPLANLRKNIENMGKPNTFHGQGQSLGGAKPGEVMEIVLPNPGPLGVRVEKRSNNSASAIVNQVVPGSQAEASGLQRGDVICFAGSRGQNEISYDMFLQIAKSPERPIHLEARRLVNNNKKTTPANAAAASTNSSGKKGVGLSADAEARRKNVIAAAEAREKKHKRQTKSTVKYVTKSTLKKQEEKHVNNFTSEELQPQTEASRQAAAAAKQGEANLAAELGYNPYEAVKKTAGQARTATTTTQHGEINAPGGSNSNSNSAGSSIPAVAPPANPTSAAPAEIIDHELPLEFEEALVTIISCQDKDAARTGLKIARTLIVNATTKGQQQQFAATGEDAKFRKVRLANKKIKKAIVDVPGNIQLMMSVGFQLIQEDSSDESLLVFPPFDNGPAWLPTALRKMEQQEKAL